MISSYQCNISLRSATAPIWLQTYGICLEAADDYEKQIYQSLFYIYAANGRAGFMLNLPIDHRKARKYKDIQHFL